MTGFELRAPFGTFTDLYLPPEMSCLLADWYEDPGKERELPSVLATAALDVYSLGLTILEALTPGDEVFYERSQALTDRSLWWSWLSTPPNMEASIEARLEAVDTDVRSMLLGMLKREPCQRWTVSECLKHPWLAADKHAGDKANGPKDEAVATKVVNRGMAVQGAMPRVSTKKSQVMPVDAEGNAVSHSSVNGGCCAVS